MRLVIKRGVIGVLGDDHMGDQRLGRQATLDQPRRGWCLHHGAGAGSAGIFRPTDHEHAELQRNHIQPLCHILADRVERAGAAGTSAVLDIDHQLSPWQVFG